MTVPRHDELDSAFGSWLRSQPVLDSKKGYAGTAGPFLWSSGSRYILLVERRHMSEVKPFKIRFYTRLDKALSADSGYRGLWILKFENSGPVDGKIFIRKFDHSERWTTKAYTVREYKEISESKLINFLKLEW